MLVPRPRRHSPTDLNAKHAVIYGRFLKTYVECKAYTKPVDLKEVAKFKEVLIQNRISPSAGLFVTSGSFSPRAHSVGVRLVDGSELTKWERRASFRIYTKRFLRGGATLLAVGALSMWILDEKGTRAASERCSRFVCTLANHAKQFAVQGLEEK